MGSRDLAIVTILGSRRWHGQARVAVDRIGEAVWDSFGGKKRSSLLSAIATVGTMLHSLRDAWSMVFRLRRVDREYGVLAWYIQRALRPRSKSEASLLVVGATRDALLDVL